MPQTITAQCGNTVRRAAAGQRQAPPHLGPEGMNVHPSTTSSRTTSAQSALSWPEGSYLWWLQGSHQTCAPPVQIGECSTPGLGTQVSAHHQGLAGFSLAPSVQGLWGWGGVGVGVGGQKPTHPFACLQTLPLSKSSKPGGIHWLSKHTVRPKGSPATALSNRHRRFYCSFE